MKRIGWMQKKTDDSLLQELDINHELLGHVRKRKLSYFGTPLQRSRLPDNENSSRRVRGRKAKAREATETVHRQHQAVDKNDITLRTGCRRSQSLETTRQSSDGGQRSHMIC